MFCFDVVCCMLLCFVMNGVTLFCVVLLWFVMCCFVALQHFESCVLRFILFCSVLFCVLFRLCCVVFRSVPWCLALFVPCLV